MIFPICSVCPPLPPEAGEGGGLGEEGGEVPFSQCRVLFERLGLASWDKRGSIFTLTKTDRLIREIKNLDNQVRFFLTIIRIRIY